jgi:hypothetical protein
MDDEVGGMGWAVVITHYVVRSLEHIYITFINI